MPLITTGFRGLLPACYYYESDREERARLKQEDIGILLGGCQLLSALKSLSNQKLIILLKIMGSNGIQGGQEAKPGMPHTDQG